MAIVQARQSAQAANLTVGASTATPGPLADPLLSSPETSQGEQAESPAWILPVGYAGWATAATLGGVYGGIPGFLAGVVFGPDATMAAAAIASASVQATAAVGRRAWQGLCGRRSDSE